jgi:hypothetical protein
MMYKRILQVILAVISLILIITGALGIIAGVTDNVGDFYGVSVSNSIEGHIILDSNLRFFGGLSIGLGLIMFWIIPSIERHKLVFRLIAGMIFLGGLGRVISMLSFGIPSPLFIIFALLELLFPLLIFLQNRIPQA